MRLVTILRGVIQPGEISIVEMDTFIAEVRVGPALEAYLFRAFE